jgi:hypothetical protein
MTEIEQYQFNEQSLRFYVFIEASQDDLSEMFERLNSGVQLTNSDKLWNRRHTPLVRLTRECVLTNAGLRAVWGETNMENRGHLANYVALVAGILIDTNCFTNSYMRLHPHLEVNGDREKLSSVLQMLVGFYEEANARFPVTKRSHLAKYRKVGFINAYFLTDLAMGDMPEHDCRQKWLTMIGHLRNPETSDAAHAALATKGAQNLTLFKIATVIKQVDDYLAGTFQGFHGAQGYEQDDSSDDDEST